MKTSLNPVEKGNMIFVSFFPVIMIFIPYLFQDHDDIPNKIWLFSTIPQAVPVSIIFISLMKREHIEKIAILDIYFNFNLNIRVQIIKYLVVYAYMLSLYFTLNKAGYWAIFYPDVNMLNFLMISIGFFLTLFIVWYIMTFKSRRKLSKNQ